jgi:hypothetical protein
MPNQFKVGDEVTIIRLPSKAHTKKHKLGEIRKIVSVSDDGVDYLYKLEDSGYRFDEDSLALVTNIKK